MLSGIKLMIICVLCLSAYGCQPAEPIKIGFAAGLSGANSEVGVGARNGILLLIEQINASGGINGRNLELIVKDDENKLDVVARVDQELIDSGVIAIIGHDMSSKLATSLKTIEGQKVLLMSPSISDYRASGIDDSFIRTIPTNYDQGVTLASFAVENDKKHRFFAVADVGNTAFYEGIVSGFEAVIGDKIVLITIEKGIADDIARIRTEFSSGDYDGVLMVLNSKDAAYLVQSLKQDAKDIHFYSSNWAMTQDFIELSGSNMEGVRFVSTVDFFLETPKYLEFKTAYQTRYKSDPYFSAVYAYETGQLLVEAIQKSNKLTHDALKAKILSLSPFESIQGTLQLDAFGDVRRNLFINSIENGEFIKLK